MRGAVATDWLAELSPATPAVPAASQGKARPGTLRAFLEEDIAGDAGPWVAEGHEPLLEIIEKIDRAILEKKSGTEVSVLAGEQTGKTLVALGAALQLTADRHRNVGYFLPSQTFADRFGRTRLKRIITRSPYLAGRMKDQRDAVNRMALKEFDGHFFYLLGLESITDAISIPLDAIFYDEVDHLPTENQEWSEGRIAASDLKVMVFVSAGYIPGGGIDQRFTAGTQHRWLVDCKARRCGAKSICLEETFPDCVAKVKDVWTRVCPACGKPLDVVANGRWVATFPRREKDGNLSYRLPSLVLTARDLAHTMKRWDKAQKKKSRLPKFRCAELALPDAGALQPISPETLNRMQDPQARLSDSRGVRPRYAGMDTGDVCHFVAIERLPSGQPQLVWAEEIDSDVAEMTVPALCARLGVASFVIDKKPLTNTARRIAYSLGKMAALQDFQDTSELRVVDEEHETHVYRCVKVHRDESLDDLTAEIADEKRPLVMPDIEKYAVLETVASHLKNLRKERSFDTKGREVDKYVKGIANHFGMALNSARIAELIAPVIVEWTPETHVTVPQASRRSRGAIGRVI